MALTALAALWGFGEATLFFIVPDVLLTLLALRDRRLALEACAFAIGGAIAGGCLMYLWGAANLARAEAVLDAVPAISQADVARVRSQLIDHGVLAVLFGPASGTPYKIYAVESPSAGIGLAAFLAISVPGRGLRFVLLTLLTGWVTAGPLATWPHRRRTTLLVTAWTAFYAWYFIVKWD